MSRQQVQTEYSPSSMVGGDISPFIDAYTDRSAKAKQDCDRLMEVPYGRDKTQTLDLFVPEGQFNKPLLVFIHGGYWQLLSKNESLFPLPGCRSAGIAFASIDYTLAPHATLEEIVAECEQALVFLKKNAANYGYDASNIYVSGSSAGAHLAAMAGTSLDFLAGLILVSGVFELAPLLLTDTNKALGLTKETARQNSPARLKPIDFPPSIICWGEFDTDEFKRQSLSYGAKLDELNFPVTLFEVADKNHFDIILDLTDPTTQLGKSCHDFIEQTGNRRAKL